MKIVTREMKAYLSQGEELEANGEIIEVLNLGEAEGSIGSGGRASARDLGRSFGHGDSQQGGFRNGDA